MGVVSEIHIYVPQITFVEWILYPNIDIICYISSYKSLKGNGSEFCVDFVILSQTEVRNLEFFPNVTTFFSL